MAVVGQNATLLQEIPLFTSQEPVNNILLHQVEHLQINSHSYCAKTHRHKKCPEYLLYYSVFLRTVPCVSRAGLWWAALCLWLASRLKAALCIPAARCAPEPEAWAVCGAQPRQPAGTRQPSEYYRNITMNWRASRKRKSKGRQATGLENGSVMCKD